jgi:nucleoside-diphosphate-sugar epimerase
MRHLVTGGSGFLGALIGRRLAARGEEVLAVDVWEDKARPAGVEYASCDVRDRKRLADLMRGVDVVHHNAALVPLTKSGLEFRSVNVDGSRIVAEVAAANRVKAFIHMSSSAIFGAPARVPITLETPAAPIEIYGRSKWAGEQAVAAACRQGGVPLIVIRPRTILAPSRLGIFQILFEWIQEGRDVYVIGSGNVLFQFVHADDLMSAYLLALDQGRPGVYNVGTDQFGTLRAALETLIAHAGSTSRVRSLPEGITMLSLKALDRLGLSPLAPWHYLTYHKAFYFDIQQLLQLGWKPEYSNDRMLRESYQWFLEHGREKPGAGASPHRKAVKESILWLLRKIS